jgi:hypothetical protein
VIDELINLLVFVAMIAGLVAVIADTVRTAKARGQDD